MARSDVSVEELRAFGRDLSSAAGVINKAADELAQAGLGTVLVHSTMMRSTLLPGIDAFSSDVLAAAIKTAMAAKSGRETQMERDIARVARRKELKEQGTGAAPKKKAAK